MSIIRDGSGTGRSLTITDENKALVSATTISRDSFINTNYQKVWSLPFEAVDPAGADDYFFYMTNTGAVNLRITDIRLHSTVVGVAKVMGVSGTPSYASATAVSPANRSIGSSRLPPATVNVDANITGLTSLGTIFHMVCDTAGKTLHLRTSANIIIPPGQALALQWGAATGAITGVVSVVEGD